MIWLFVYLEKRFVASKMTDIYDVVHLNIGGRVQASKFLTAVDLMTISYKLIRENNYSYAYNAL